MGLCASDLVGVRNAANSVQRRLLYCREAGEESWYGTWAEINFQVFKSKPFITLSREIARLESVNVCQHPIPVQNQFYEYLRFGNGSLPKLFQRDCCHWPMQVLSRNNVVTFVDMTNPPQLIAVYASDPADQDATRRILIQGTDASNNTVFSQDGFSEVSGIFLPFVAPFSATPFPFQTITGIQKDITNGPIQIFQMDPTTGSQILLLTMQPTETTAFYRRYFFHPVPLNCCAGGTSSACAVANPTDVEQPITVTAIAKLELIPMLVDTDYSLIQNLEAMVEEGNSLRYSRVDNRASKAMSLAHHTQAVRLLNGELVHYMGETMPAINFAPFGTARLERVRIGMI
jgi:hypothetical protein